MPVKTAGPAVSIDRLVTHAIVLAADRVDVQGQDAQIYIKDGEVRLNVMLSSMGNGYTLSIVLAGNVTSVSLIGLLSVCGACQSRSLILKGVTSSPLPARGVYEPLALWRQRIATYLRGNASMEQLLRRGQYAFNSGA